VENLLGLRPTLARRVIDVAGEKPLVAEQLVRSWAERSWLVPGPDGYDLVDGVEPTFPGLDRLLAERVGDPDRLPRPLLHLLGLAALLPEPLPSERWAEAARRAGLPSPDGAADLGAERGLLFLGPRGWSFRHAALREAVREAAERDAGARLHRAVADLLLATGGPGTQAGEHLLQAGDAAAALPLLRAATLRRIDHSDHSSAARSLQLWRRALVALEGDPHALPWGDWWVQQAFVARAEARFDLAFAAATEAAAIAAEHGDAALACAARLERGRCLLNVGRHDEAATELLASRADAQACGALGTAAAASRMAALARQYQGRHDGAATLAEESLQLYRSLGQPLRAAWAAVTWSQVEKQRGDLAEVERLLRLAQELLPPGQGEAVQAEVENGLGELLRLRGDLDQAQAHYEAALRWGRAAGSTDRAVVEANLGFLLLRRRAWAEARARLLPAREDFERQRRKALVVTLDVALLTAAGGLADWPEWDLRQALVDAGLGDFTYFEIAIHAELPEDQRPVSA
jgi:tetratricopeptide (TPR) repeat protein